MYYRFPSDPLNQIEKSENLNLLEPQSCENYGRLKDFGSIDPVYSLARPVFRNIEQELIKEIKRHEIIIGCVAWLTSIPILEALQGKSVQFVVQQEDWLRPDSGEWSLAKQRALYQSLEGVNNYIAEASQCAYFDVNPIRLCGKPKTKNRSNPRMHHKFAIFGNYIPSEYQEDGYVSDAYKFDLLWTGSYNFTANATNSLENGLFVNSKEIIDAYKAEWRQVLLSSFRIEDRWWGESYGWEDDSCLRDGT